MKHCIVKKSRLHGTLTIPSSKSQTLRALLFAFMGKGKSLIHNFLPSPDTEAMIQAARSLGAKISIINNSIKIVGLNGSLAGAARTIDAGNSGLVLRFISALAGLSPSPIEITGDESIRNNRPMGPLLNGLSQLGVKAVSTRNNGYAPVTIQGPIHSGKALVSGEDSQPVSGLLIAGAFAAGPVEVFVKNPGEKPWIGLTLHWFEKLGIPYENHQFELYKVLGNARYDGFEYNVPGDLSSAAFPIAAALITQSEITLHNVDLNDPQGDKKLIYLLQEMGAELDMDAEKKILHVRRSKKPLQGFSVDINDFIDGIAVLAVIGCYAQGETHIHNAAVAKTKECNRIHSLAVELRKMGAEIIELDDGLRIRHSSLRGAHLNSHHDHRLAMALSVAALGADGESRIDNTACIAKTYPNFIRDFTLLGAQIEASP